MQQLTIGQFISEDSYWGEDNNSLSLNLYTYAHNNPIRFIDPTGHSAQEIDAIISQIDQMKALWWSEESGAGKGVSEWTSLQIAANEEANKLRQTLLDIEKNNDLKELIKSDQSGVVGAWQDYRVEIARNNINEKIEAIQQKQNEQYKDKEIWPWEAKKILMKLKNYQE